MKLLFVLVTVFCSAACSPLTAERKHQVIYYQVSESRVEKHSDSFDWQKKTPADFLELLRSRGPEAYYTVRGEHKNWIKYSDITKLIELLDSTVPCAAVARSISSYIDFNGSTIGDEAAFLIIGFQKGHYPPDLNSTRPKITASDKHRLKEWWADVFLK
ncbi:hypothetical protein [Psychromonas ossibalaenae]|uniref:hypothetical protein n=1 Tax=Psychromonas ossibalaenae TaxID=444922 RepID=UPI0003618BB5|nr:hypothetical protein [Psychromonas ossibalaenae]